MRRISQRTLLGACLRNFKYPSTLNDRRAIPRLLSCGEIVLMNLAHGCLEHTSKIFGSGCPTDFNLRNWGLICHGKVLTFLNSSHIKMTPAIRQYCVALVTRRSFPYLLAIVKCTVLAGDLV